MRAAKHGVAYHHALAKSSTTPTCNPPGSNAYNPVPAAVLLRAPHQSFPQTRPQTDLMPSTVSTPLAMSRLPQPAIVSGDFPRTVLPSILAKQAAAKPPQPATRAQTRASHLVEVGDDSLARAASRTTTSFFCSLAMVIRAEGVVNVEVLGEVGSDFGIAALEALGCMLMRLYRVELFAVSGCKISVLSGSVSACIRLQS